MWTGRLLDGVDDRAAPSLRLNEPADADLRIEAGELGRDQHLRSPSPLLSLTEARALVQAGEELACDLGRAALNPANELIDDRLIDSDHVLRTVDHYLVVATRL